MKSKILFLFVSGDDHGFKGGGVGVGRRCGHAACDVPAGGTTERFARSSDQADIGPP